MISHKKITMIFVVLILIFYGGYRLGLVYGGKLTTEILLDVSQFQVAARAATGITDLHKIQPSVKENKAALCQMRTSVLRMAEDIANCKQSQGCAKDFTGPFYVQAEKYVSEFEKIACP